MDVLIMVGVGIVVACIGLLSVSATYESLFTPSSSRYQASEAVEEAKPSAERAVRAPSTEMVAPPVASSLSNLANALGAAPGIPTVERAKPREADVVAEKPPAG